MKRTTIFITLLLLASLSLSVQSSESDQNLSFTTIGDLFVNGTSPNTAQLEGKLLAGRCFNEHSPNYAKGTGYLLAGQTGNYKVLTFLVDTSDIFSRPFKYDNITAAQFIKEAIDYQHDYYQTIHNENGLITSIGEQTSTLKKSGNIFVEELSDNTQAQNHVYMRCYYFKINN